jgi:conjugal transfer pilus assembly protein TraV
MKPGRCTTKRSPGPLSKIRAGPPSCAARRGSGGSLMRQVRRQLKAAQVVASQDGADQWTLLTTCRPSRLPALPARAAPPRKPPVLHESSDASPLVLLHGARPLPVPRHRRSRVRHVAPRVIEPLGLRRAAERPRSRARQRSRPQRPPSARQSGTGTLPADSTSQPKESK